MSLSNTTVGTTYACNGVTTSFAIPFQWQRTSEINVYLIDILAGTSTLLALTTNYTFSPNSITPTSIITNLTYSAAYKIRVERATALNQLIDFINNSSFLAEDLEDGLDKLMQTVQEINFKLSTAIRIPLANYGVDQQLPLLVPGQALVVNGAGTGFTMSGSPVGVIDVPPVVSGSDAAPGGIVAGTGVPFTGSGWFNVKFIQGSGGPVIITANPKIAVGSVVGQMFTLIGCSDTNTVTINDGTGVQLNGPITLAKYSTLDLIWNGTVWSERARS